MLAGRKLLEALIVYCKIDVAQSLNEIKMRNVRRKSVDNIVEEEKTSIAIS